MCGSVPTVWYCFSITAGMLSLVISVPCVSHGGELEGSAVPQDGAFSPGQHSPKTTGSAGGLKQSHEDSGYMFVASFAICAIEKREIEKWERGEGERGV